MWWQKNNLYFSWKSVTCIVKMQRSWSCKTKCNHVSLLMIAETYDTCVWLEPMMWLPWWGILKKQFIIGSLIHYISVIWELFSSMSQSWAVAIRGVIQEYAYGAESGTWLLWVSVYSSKGFSQASPNDVTLRKKWSCSRWQLEVD